MPDCEDRSTTSVRLLHGGILLPSGISGKMIISPDTITIIAMLVLSLLSLMSRCLPLVKYQPLNNAMITFNLFDLANHCWLCYRLLNHVLALLVAGAVAFM